MHMYVCVCAHACVQTRRVRVSMCAHLRASHVSCLCIPHACAQYIPLPLTLLLVFGMTGAERMNVYVCAQVCTCKNMYSFPTTVHTHMCLNMYVPCMCLCVQGHTCMTLYTQICSILPEICSVSGFGFQKILPPCSS